jgi:hypothetical protein
MDTIEVSGLSVEEKKSCFSFNLKSIEIAEALLNANKRNNKE